MLGLIEQLLVSRLQADAVLQQGLKPTILAGAAQPPKDAATPCLAVWARALRTAATELGADEPDRREPARLIRRLTLQPDASGLAFALPVDGFDDRTDQISEITIDGRQLRAGDDYLLDGRTIRFLRPPGGPLLVRILGAAARGYVEHCAAEIELALFGWGAPGASWDQQSTTADTLVVHAVAVALAAIADRDVLDLATDADAGFDARLLRPRGRVGAAARMAQHGDASAAPAAQAVVVLRGDLELTLAKGAPEPEGGLIQQVTLDPTARLVVS